MERIVVLNSDRSLLEEEEHRYDAGGAIHVVVDEAKLTLNQFLRQAAIELRGVRLNRADWSEDSHSLAFTLRSLRGRFLIHGMLNAYWEPLTFELPPQTAETQERWQRWIDTALQSPDDIRRLDESALKTYVVQPRSLVFLAMCLQSARETVSDARR